MKNLKNGFFAGLFIACALILTPLAVHAGEGIKIAEEGLRIKEPPAPRRECVKWCESERERYCPSENILPDGKCKLWDTKSTGVYCCEWSYPGTSE